MQSRFDLASAATAARSLLGLCVSVAMLALLRGVAVSAVPAGGAWLSSARRPDEVLVVLLAWVGAALAAWLALGSGLALLSCAPGALGRACGRLAERLTPTLVRKVLTVVIGTSTVSLALPPATVVGTVAAPLPVGERAAEQRAADPAGGVRLPGPRPGFAPTVVGARSPGLDAPGYQPTPRTTPAPAPESAPPPAPGFRPTAPTPVHDGATSALLARAPRPTAAALDTVTVRRGDTLWSIAQQHLGSGAGDAEVARAWPRWYAANRAVIGADPDLIHPGTVLVPPREGDPR